MNEAAPSRLVIWVRWDAEHRVWYGGSDQVPGLFLEHKDFDQLVEAALDVTPDLLEAEGREHLRSLPIHILADRIEVPA